MAATLSTPGSPTAAVVLPVTCVTSTAVTVVPAVQIRISNLSLQTENSLTVLTGLLLALTKHLLALPRLQGAAGELDL